MSNDKPHQGWSNYETWTVHRWIDSDEESKSYWEEQAEKFFDPYEGRGGGEQRAVSKLADQLKDEVEDAAVEILKAGRAERSAFSDLLTTALLKVDWEEIAGEMIANLKA